ncbi:MAG: hypothetical protein WDW38_005610 [Sanguina aurantia]
MVESCGKFSYIAYPGCNCVCGMLGQRVAGVLSLRVQQLDVKVETKTSDNVFADLMVSVQYQVHRESAYDAFYKLTSSKQQISAHIFDVVRATVPKMLLDDVFLQKEEIAGNIKTELTKAMTAYGFNILHALVTDVEPALKVKEAMNDINAARRQRVAAVEKAEAAKVNVVKAAEAESEAKFLQGQGIARQREAIVNGLKNSVGDFTTAVPNVSSKEVLELLLITQYFDTLKEIGANNKSSTVFMSHNPGALSDITTQLRSGFMEASAAARMTPA